MTPRPSPCWKHYRDLEVVWPEWIIEDLLPAHSMICLYGRRGIGKTFLAIDWAACTATGTAWLGHPTTRGAIAYLLAERPEGLKRRMLGWLALRDTEGRAAKLLEDEVPGVFFVAQGRHALDTSQGQQAIIESLRKLPQISLLVIDPLVVFMNGQENDTRDMQRFADGVREIVKAHGCSVLLVHHEGKQNWENRLGARGSSALEAALDTILYLKGKGETVTLEMTKQREATAIKPLFLRFPKESSDSETGLFPELALPPPKAAAEPKPSRVQREYDRIVAVIEGAKANGEPSLAVQEIQERVSDLNIKSSTLRNRLKKLTPQKLSEHMVGRQLRYCLAEATEPPRAAAE